METTKFNRNRFFFLTFKHIDVSDSKETEIVFGARAFSRKREQCTKTKQQRRARAIVSFSGCPDSVLSFIAGYPLRQGFDHPSIDDRCFLLNATRGTLPLSLPARVEKKQQLPAITAYAEKTGPEKIRIRGARTHAQSPRASTDRRAGREKRRATPLPDWPSTSRRADAACCMYTDLPCGRR